MSWVAIDRLDDARADTQSLLLPFEFGTWLRLAVVSFFVGGAGGGGGLSAAQNGAGAPSPRPPSGVEMDLPASLSGGGVPALSTLPVRGLTLLVAAVAFVAVVALGYALVAAVAEFVLLDGVRSHTVRLRRPARQFLGPGLRLFAFRLALLVVGAALVGGPAALLLVGVGPLVAVPLVLLVAVVVVPVLYLVARFTTDFAVPTMVAEGRSVTSAWRRLLPLLGSEWREFGLYLVVRVVLAAAASVAVGLVVGLVALVVAIPFVAVGGLVVAVAGLSPATLAVVGVLVAAFVVVLVAVSAVVQVPVVVYFRYYSLYVLGDIDAKLDLVGARSTSTP